MFSSKSFSILAFLSLAACCVVTTTSAQNSDEDSGARTRDLLIEKRDALASYVAYAETQFLQGTLPSWAVLDAKLKLLDTKLDLADSHAERIRIFEERLENRRFRESRLEQAFGTGDVTYGEKIEATVERLDAAIALAKERG
ncbi:MAG: hypothetical protein RIK87_06250 [Fuerstiella sp.]